LTGEGLEEEEPDVGDDSAGREHFNTRRENSRQQQAPFFDSTDNNKRAQKALIKKNAL
jgi:hypothetical protein